MDYQKAKENEFINKCSKLLEAYKSRIFGLKESEEVTKY